MTWRLAASTAGGAGPGPWVQFTGAPTVTAFVDSSRVQSTATGGFTVWVRFDYRSTQHLRSSNLSYDHTIAHTEIECIARRARELGGQLLDASGKVVNDETISSPTWHPFESGGMGPRVYDSLCGFLAGHAH
jgi:hypothetical protein